MKKKIIFTSFLSFGLFVLAGCGGNNDITTSTQTPTPTTQPPVTNTDTSIPTQTSTTTEEAEFVEKDVNIYRSKDVVDKTIKLRFYKYTPNIPYISVLNYYKEFFKTDLDFDKYESTYSYTTKNGGVLKLDSYNDILSLYNIGEFSVHPDFKDAVSQTYLSSGSATLTPMQTHSIDLSNYSIDVHGDSEAYVPISLLSSFSGGLSGYNISYLDGDIYVYDTHPQLADEVHNYDYFKKSETYYSKLTDLETPRGEDMARYNYGQICFNFDHLRGYTSQLIIGDNNLVSLGLDGLLEQYYPELKELLLSTNKKEYYAGYVILFMGLFDGGHTAAFQSYDDYMNEASDYIAQEDKITDSLSMIPLQYFVTLTAKLSDMVSYNNSKKAAFPEYDKDNNANLYNFDSNTKTAYISFDTFIVDYDGWDSYYKNGFNIEDVSQTDTYLFVRSSLYQALNDHAENVVIDLTTNGGGNSDALNGLICLFNKAESSFSMNDTFDKTRTTVKYVADVNLDGKFDELDVEECEKFNFNIVVLTSPNAFSCGNLFPSIMKELGYKIVGQKSGGGSCAITFVSTPDGLLYAQSSYHCLSDQKGHNIDYGVEVDFEIQITPDGQYFDCSKFYDFVTITNYINSLQQEI